MKKQENREARKQEMVEKDGRTLKVGRKREIEKQIKVSDTKISKNREQKSEDE